MCAGRKEPASFQRELCHVRAGPEAPYRGGLAKKGRAVVMGEALPHQPVVLGELDTLHITGREPLWGACVLHAAGSYCLPASYETCMQVKKQQLELDMEQQTGSK